MYQSIEICEGMVSNPKIISGGMEARSEYPDR
jgi:hypothetical protein